MRLKLTVGIISLFLLVMPILGYAQTASPELEAEEIQGAQNIPPEEYFKAIVIDVTDKQTVGQGSDEQLFETVRIKITSGSEKNKEVTITNVGGLSVNGGKGFEVGNKVIVNKTILNGEETYYLVDTYRIPALGWITAIFLLVVIAFSRWRGVTSLIGLAVSIAVIIYYVSPQILAGKDPLFVTLTAALAIALFSLYMAHGFNKRTSVAVVSTLITLTIAVVMAYIFVHGAKLFGNGSEESIFLQFGNTSKLNLQGLLLGGIILGALGVLDDITTAQSATVDELKKANPNLSFKELYAAGASVGKEHISSLINTLFLAYAGVSLPLFLLFHATGGSPIWVVLNAEFIAEEIVRTMVGSITLILAVPITTVLAAYYFDKYGPSGNSTHSHHHH